MHTSHFWIDVKNKNKNKTNETSSRSDLISFIWTALCLVNER